MGVRGSKNQSPNKRGEVNRYIRQGLVCRRVMKYLNKHHYTITKLVLCCQFLQNKEPLSFSCMDILSWPLLVISLDNLEFCPSSPRSCGLASQQRLSSRGTENKIQNTTPPSISLQRPHGSVLLRRPRWRPARGWRPRGPGSWRPGAEARCRQEEKLCLHLLFSSVMII